MLTKSDFLLFLESPLHLWASKHNQVEVVVPSLYDQYLMEQGKRIEKLAKVYIYDCVSKQYGNHEILWQKTYQDENYQARADAVIFDQDAQVYDIYEIKSSLNIKKEHKYDATFQTLVCEANFPFRNVYIVHLNKEYLHHGEIDFAEFFIIDEVTEDVETIRLEVEQARMEAWSLAQLKTSEGIDSCTKPNECICPKLCHPVLPDDPIYDIARIGKKAHDLKSKGILSIKDIPDDYALSDRQNIQVQALKKGRSLINQSAIKEQLATLQYPLNFLDYETFNPGIPLFDGYHPYQHIVFQYSLHVFEHSDSSPQHYEFLVTDEGDPGIKLVEHLANNLKKVGSVIVWNKTFEVGRNNDMAELYPEYRGFLMDINERVFDLMEIFSKGYYVHPNFKGSASIKNVLPVLVPALSYDGMRISKGDEAMVAWWNIFCGNFSNEDKERIERDMLEYCELDTRAMVEIWKVLSLEIG